MISSPYDTGKREMLKDELNKCIRNKNKDENIVDQWRIIKTVSIISLKRQNIQKESI
jgi:hypothetical protein